MMKMKRTFKLMVGYLQNARYQASQDTNHESKQCISQV